MLFVYDLTHWSTFLMAALLLNLSPGPDIAFILGHTVKGGARSGYAAMLGIWTGAFGHVILAVSGLSAIVAASAEAFSVIKWVGVVYLVWIGVAAIRSSGGAFLPKTLPAQKGLWKIYRQGALIDLLNPKVAIFFLAFLPQFVTSQAGPIWAQLLLHGILIILIAAVIEPPLIMFGGRFTTKLRNNPRIATWLDRTLGTLLIGLAARLVYIER